MEITLPFLHLIFVGFVALFPPVNPIGTALVVDPLLSELRSSKRRAAALKIAFYCLVICAFTLLAGSWLFKLFGISIPVVQVAGGILICRMGWQLLSSDDKASDSQTTHKNLNNDVSSILFYPVSFPMTTGPGTISVLLTLSAHGNSTEYPDYIVNLAALFAAVLLMCLLIYISYAFTPTMLRRLGKNGRQIVNRFSAFLVFCVGIQIASDGIAHLLKP